MSDALSDQPKVCLCSVYEIQLKAAREYIAELEQRIVQLRGRIRNLHLEVAALSNEINDIDRSADYDD